MEQILTRDKTLGRIGGKSQPALDEAEFEDLYRDSRDDLYAYVTSLVHERAAAEDVTAAAFERAFRKRDKFDRRRGNPRAWLFGIARNLALDALRKSKKSSELTDGMLGDAGLNAVGADDSVVDRIEVRRALMALPGPEREAVALRYFADMSLREIGQTVGISESNAGTRLHRGVEKMREAIGDVR